MKRLGVLLILALLLAACNPAPVVIEKPVVQTQIVEKIVEKQVPVYTEYLDPLPRIAVESAFGKELQLLLKNATETKQYVINGRLFTTGKLAGHDVVMYLSGVSMSNAAMTTAQALDHFNITRLVFSGISGGVNPSINIGDVVVPAQWAEYQEFTFVRENSDGSFTCKSDLPAFGYMCPSAGVSVTKKGNEPDKADKLRWFAVDPTMLAIAKALPAQLEKCTVDADKKPVCLTQQPRLLVGGNGTAGPTFVDNAKFRQYTWDTFKADSLDMESSAVAHVAYNYSKPFIIFRSLSDLAGGGQGANEIGTFGLLAANNSANTLLAFLTALPK